MRAASSLAEAKGKPMCLATKNDVDIHHLADPFGCYLKEPTANWPG